MRVLVVGRGGREHSLMIHLAKSHRISEMYAAPGNGGMSDLGTCVAIDEMDIEALIEFVKQEKIDLTIVGPEAPLNAGIANRFHEEKLAIFAPTKEAALLEGSKQYAKQFLKRHEIPTAAYAVFADADEAKSYIQEQGVPIVIKADGLAEGKGVVVAMTISEAFSAVEAMLVDRTFAEAGATIVVEEFLEGDEFSLMAFVNEENVYPMLTARDHKRAFDHDQGPNTGGMGAFAPVSDVSDDDYTYTVTNILEKTAKELVREDRSFTGILYAGLMMTKEGPKVIEFNTRFGDPETQVVLPLLENELLQVIEDVISGKNPQLTWKHKACTGVVLASQGYPGPYKKGVVIPYIPVTDHSFIVQAGTMVAEDLIANGGRVLLVGAVANTVQKAAISVYDQLNRVEELQNKKQNQAFFYRSDIGLA